MTFTPWVALPASRMSEAAVRIAVPLRVIIIRSYSSDTDWMETTLPVFSVTCIVLTPLPPRLVVR